MDEAQLKEQLRRLLESGDRRKVVRAIARLLHEEQQRRERLERMTRMRG